MTWYESLLWLAGGISALMVVLKFAKGATKPLTDAQTELKKLCTKVDKLAELSDEHYLAILRLTVINNDMPVTERLIAGKKYIDRGGNGDVKKYYEKLVEEHTK